MAMCYLTKNRSNLAITSLWSGWLVQVCSATNRIFIIEMESGCGEAMRWISPSCRSATALLSFGHKLAWNHEATLDLHPQVNQIPFEAEHQFAASFNTVDNGTAVFVKGAPERVLAMCSESSCSEFDKSRLALADGRLDEAITAEDIPPAPSDLRFLGFVGMIDPLRPGAKEAVRTCNEAGVSVSMVTGDHRVTALAIARDLGLAHDESQVMTGAQLLEKSPEELSDDRRTAAGKVPGGTERNRQPHSCFRPRCSAAEAANRRSCTEGGSFCCSDR
jgi:hypothetical protein